MLVLGLTGGPDTEIRIDQSKEQSKDQIGPDTWSWCLDQTSTLVLVQRSNLTQSPGVRIKYDLTNLVQILELTDSFGAEV